ncbi:PACE efflux transporter [Pseudomonas abieticivorans]|uniref:PACE efflux transporter n=1 Tax=Pseudomonas abieticivorans TaxID=2931382 RepID=UPI0020C020E8|nr:PACE efflux transporter [Pseudomonas sp. PIA16]
MQGARRKIVQAVLYEGIAVFCVGPALDAIFAQGLGTSTGLAVVLSSVALAWNMLFNALFERWEKGRPRTAARRVLHALGFEGGLTVMLLPVIAWWLQIGLGAALVTDVGLFVFFFFYALVFQWLFDRVFDEPVAAPTPN